MPRDKGKGKARQSTVEDECLDLRRVECEECGNVMLQKNFARHLDTYHDHSTYVYKCPKCPKTSEIKRNVEVHFLSVHLKLKYQCRYLTYTGIQHHSSCCHEYTNHSNRVTHEKKHHGGPYLGRNEVLEHQSEEVRSVKKWDLIPRSQIAVLEEQYKADLEEGRLNAQAWTNDGPIASGSGLRVEDFLNSQGGTSVPLNAFSFENEIQHIQNLELSQQGSFAMGPNPSAGPSFSAGPRQQEYACSSTAFAGSSVHASQSQGRQTPSTGHSPISSRDSNPLSSSVPWVFDQRHQSYQPPVPAYPSGSRSFVPETSCTDLAGPSHHQYQPLLEAPSQHQNINSGHNPFGNPFYPQSGQYQEAVGPDVPVSSQCNAPAQLSGPFEDASESQGTPPTQQPSENMDAGLSEGWSSSSQTQYWTEGQDLEPGYFDNTMVYQASHVGTENVQIDQTMTTMKYIAAMTDEDVLTMCDEILLHGVESIDEILLRRVIQRSTER